MSGQPGVSVPFAFSDQKKEAAASREKKTMRTKKKLGAVLIALALCILPVAAILAHFNAVNMVTAFLAFGALAGGTVTFTYSSFQTGSFGGGFAGGSNVAPTAAQAQQVNAMSALVGFTDTDTTFTFTHNWGLSAADIAALQPYVDINVASGQQAIAVAVVPNLAVSVANANVVVFTKVQATGSGCTVSIVLRRPASISQ
jgi:hypothetical protein